MFLFLSGSFRSQTNHLLPMKRVVVRILPDGITARVFPFHVSIKGLETAVLCRNDADYDTMVKVLCISARRCNVIIVIYAVVSNHCHAAILARCQEDADAFCRDIKKIYSMYFSRKYGIRNILHRIECKAVFIDSDWYVRNTLAYIPRNALDNGCNINDYEWSGYRAMFSRHEETAKYRKVASLTQRERLAIMHTGDDLRNVSWLIDEKNRLVPWSFCDTDYLEQAFENDQSFFLKTIGGQNSSELRYSLEEKPYVILPDGDFLKLAEETCRRWFNQGLEELSVDKKIRLIPYLYHTCKTTIPQLSRIFGLQREQVERIVKRKAGGR